MLNCFTKSHHAAIPIISVVSANFAHWLTAQSETTQTWLQQQNFTAKSDSFCLIPNQKGEIKKVVVGQKNADDFFYSGQLAANLPKGIYQLEKWHDLSALAWGMGAYQFMRYKTANKTPGQLVLPHDQDHSDLFAQLRAIYFVRDLTNTPTDDMGPAQLAEHAEKLAAEFGAECKQFVGDELLTHNYPCVHAVGRASAQVPRIIDIHWGDKKAPKITLTGKGVSFDSGGLNIKNASGMALMKKDMSGAAHALALAYLIMQVNLPVRLRVIIPAVENAVSGNAYHPGDVIKTRKGLTVEIGNTDAEGRMILADTLFEGASENPELLIDIATLTGAARVALGADLPALFTHNDELANELMSLGKTCQDPLWRLPIYKPYRKLLDSQIADINNCGTSPYAGAITAALFLNEFVPENLNWVHIDMMAWNLGNSSAHPEGAEALTIRTLYAYLKKRFGK